MLNLASRHIKGFSEWLKANSDKTRSVKSTKYAVVRMYTKDIYRHIFPFCILRILW
jgi:hypothetical protein